MQNKSQINTKSPIKRRDLMIVSDLKVVERMKLQSDNQKLETMTMHAIKYKSTRKCRHSGMDHDVGQCPAKGKTCMKCKKIGHFAHACLSREKRTETRINNKFH